MKRGTGHILFFIYIFCFIWVNAGLNARQNTGDVNIVEPSRTVGMVFYRIGIAFYDLRRSSVPSGELGFVPSPKSPGQDKWNRSTDLEKKNAYLMQYSRAMAQEDKPLAARFARAAAGVFYWEREMDSARYYHERALELYKELKDSFMVSLSHMNIGLTYFYQNQFEEALKYTIKALDIAERIGNKGIINNCYQHIGDIYYTIGNYNKALEYHHMSLVIRETLKDPLLLGNSYINIGMCHAGKKNYPRALPYFKKALSSYREAGSSGGMSETLLEIAGCHLAWGDFNQASDYLNRSLEMVRETKNQVLIARNLYQQAVVFMAQKQFDAARSNLEKCLQIAPSIDDKKLLKDVHFQLAAIYETRNQHKQALEHFQTYAQIKYSLAPLEIRKRMMDAQLRYQSEKQKQTIASLQKDNEIKNLRLSKNLLIRNLIIAGFVLLFAVVLYFARRYISMLLFWKRQKYAGSYRLLDKIGSGGMGTVYKARGIARKSGMIAVKVLREELFNDQEGRERFEREAKIVSNLDHPNIVKMIEYGMHRDKLFIAMELLNGKDLAAEIKEKGRVDIRRAVAIAVQVADALENIHRRRFVHRDLKPENIMLVPGPENPDHIKLLDFGLARGDAHARLTATGIIVGTLGYMPPEMVTGSHCTSAGDIYSLGVIIYEMTTGERPFYARSTTDLMRQILNTTPTPPRKRRPEVPEQLDKLVMLMLEKEEEKRPSAPVVLDILNETREKEAGT